MADISYWFEELQKEVDQYQILVDRLKIIVESSNLKAIELLIKDCDAKAVRIREVKKSFTLEVRLIRDRSVRSNYESQAAVYDDRFSASLKDYNSCKNKANKKDLLKESNTSVGFSTAGKDNDALLGEAHRIQDLTMESLSRTRNMVEASKEIGTTTLEQLRGQKEQIVEIENEVDNIATNLVRAEMLVRNFTRRMATDRIIQLFTAFNIVVMLGLILYVAVSGNSLSARGGEGGNVGPPLNTNSSRPTLRPSFRPTVLPTKLPTITPSQTPSLIPTFLPSISPSFLPSLLPTLSPSSSPTVTNDPSPAPTIEPSPGPSFTPTTGYPTILPSLSPTMGPSPLPTLSPTPSPTTDPSPSPTILPSLLPSVFPTLHPTLSPSHVPSPSPSLLPTILPFLDPSLAPSPEPSAEPSLVPV